MCRRIKASRIFSNESLDSYQPRKIVDGRTITFSSLERKIHLPFVLQSNRKSLGRVQVRGNHASLYSNWLLRPQHRLNFLVNITSPPRNYHHLNQTYHHLLGGKRGVLISHHRPSKMKKRKRRHRSHERLQFKQLQYLQKKRIKNHGKSMNKKRCLSKACVTLPTLRSMN